MTDSNGTITRSAEHATITFERRLAHPIEAVWEAITDPALVGQWLSPFTLEPRAGGRVEIDFGDDGGLTTGRVLTFEPPRTFEHEWHYPGETESVVRYELAADGAGTVLTLTHRRLGAQFASGYGAGWHAHLDRLTAVLDGTDCPDWDERFAVLLPAYR